MSFYTNYIDQCNKKGLSPSAAAEAMGFKRSMVTRWSKGSAPRQATLQRMADYFSCSVDDLADDNPAAKDDGEDDLQYSIIQMGRPMSPSEIVSCIESILRDRNIKKSEFYAACGVSPQMFAYWRANVNFPSMKTLNSINGFLGTSFGISMIKEEPATTTDDGLVERIASLDSDLQTLLIDFLELAQANPETAKRHLLFAVGELQFVQPEC